MERGVAPLRSGKLSRCFRNRCPDSSESATPVKVNELAKLLRCNKKYIAAHIRYETGMTIKSFIDSERVETAVQALIHSRNTIGEIAFMTGFPDQYTFSRFFKKLKGISPKKFRQKQNSSK